MYCTKCGVLNPDDYKFCQRCGAPASPIIKASPVNEAPLPQQNTVHVQNTQNIQPGTGVPQYNANTPQNTGYVQSGNVPPPVGYNAPNAVYRPMPGAYPNTNTYPHSPKKKNPVLIAAGILLSLTVVIVAVLLASIKPPINDNGNGGNAVLADNGDNSPDVSDIGTAEDGFRNNYTEILGNGDDVVTVMVYICGGDLESDGGCGTLDINEMLAADLGDNVNLILQTGGCSAWSTRGIIDGEVQRWAVEDGVLVELQELGQRPMLDSGELSDFISFSAENFPANRYQFIFWDHGGGSLYGFGSDEIYPDTVLFLPDIAEALEDSGVRFDFIGFDACLMGSIETAYMLEPYADYLVGSEETEPAYGWDYTPWLNSLGENPSIDTIELGTAIVDSFLEHNASAQGEQEGADTTLSVVALREIPYVYDMLCSYMDNATEALVNKEFKMISTALSRTRAFAEGDYDLIDIADFAKRADLEGKEELTAALSSAVKYTDSSARTGVYGLSMYFPYTDLSVYGYAKEKFSEFGFGGSVYDFYDTFVNILAGGQNNSTTRSLKENFTDTIDVETDYSSYAWYDNSEVLGYSYDGIDYTELEILQDETTGKWYLPLTEEDWSLLTYIEMQILLDDGEGYIDLGSDQYFETDDAGNLLLNYGADNTWVALDGQIVCYYAEETYETDYGSVFIGYVPAVLNGTTDIDIILEWDGEDADGYIVGYRLTQSNSTIGGEGTLGKGYKQFKTGDQLDFVCDYYTYDGDYDTSYYFGDTLTIGDTLPAVTYEDVGEDPVLECYMLVDVYQNYSWTETVEFSTEY